MTLTEKTTSKFLSSSCKSRLGLSRAKKLLGEIRAIRHTNMSSKRTCHTRYLSDIIYACRCDGSTVTELGGCVGGCNQRQERELHVNDPNKANTVSSNNSPMITSGIITWV